MHPAPTHRDVPRPIERERSRPRAHASTLQRSFTGDDDADAPPQLTPLRIAILDRDSGFLVVLAKRLERLEWSHRVLAPTISTKKIASMCLDALVIDLAVLGPRPWRWLERLCLAGPKYRIIICTGPSSVEERVCALQMGADDWLSKPCHPEELVARIEAVVGHRRRSKPRSVEPVTVGEVEIRCDQYQAFVAGRSLRLTRREFEFIELLAGADNEVFERERIYKRLWGPEMARNDRSLDVFVHKLRRKLERASPQWRYIHTHWGRGFRFSAELLDRSDAALDGLGSELEESKALLAA